MTDGPGSRRRRLRGLVVLSTVGAVAVVGVTLEAFAGAGPRAALGVIALIVVIWTLVVVRIGRGAD